MAIASLVQGAIECAVAQPLRSLAFLVIVVPLSYFILNEWVRRQARISGLKGPTGLPVIGNIGQIRVNAAQKYREWAKTWGPVYQIQLGNVPVVVVNSAAAAKVLFGQNAQALSSRPEFYTFHKVKAPSP
jgi:3-hydroxyphenylacetate 6-hydroxylase